MRVAVLQIYNDQIQDLLKTADALSPPPQSGNGGPNGASALSSASSGPASCALVTAPFGARGASAGANAAGAAVNWAAALAGKEEVHRPAADAAAAMALIERGAAARATAATNRNEASSRSHLICRLELTSAAAGGQGSQKLRSVLTLVDLAGSEGAPATDGLADRKARAAEGGGINQSLLQLKIVFDALARGDRPCFRGERLTEVLRVSERASGRRGVGWGSGGPCSWEVGARMVGRERGSVPSARLDLWCCAPSGKQHAPPTTQPPTHNTLNNTSNHINRTRSPAPGRACR